MHAPSLPRRQLLGTAAAALPLLLAGCRRDRSQLLVSRGDFPSLWGTRLPRDWSQRTLEEPAAVAGTAGGPPGENRSEGRPALLQLWDGWAFTLPEGALAPFGAQQLLERLDPIAAPASRLFAPEGSAPLAFPWALDPWVLLLRDRPDLARRHQEGWHLLLDPSLQGKVVLPSSPRVTITLARHDSAALRTLRRAALASDERNGLNLLLGGEAEALVLPRRRAVPLLRSDPRLQVVLPNEGAPLGWNLLLRPAGVRSDLPIAWLEAGLQEPLLSRLMAAGWVPPLPRPQLLRAAASLPGEQRRLLVPPAEQLRRCWSLPPLNDGERGRLQDLWDAAAPASSPAAG